MRIRKHLAQILSRIPKSEIWRILKKNIFISNLLYFRFSPYEWDNPHPCTEEPEVTFNILFYFYSRIFEHL